jgi:hypothetical protein
MAVTVENLRTVEQAASNLRSLVQRKAVADGGTIRYHDPVSGTEKTATVAPADKTAVVNAYKAALSALKSAVQALTE